MNYRTVLPAGLWAAGLFILNFIIPVLGQAAALFTPLPLILAYVRTGRREGIIALLLSVLIVAALAGWPAAAVFFLGFGLMAAGISEGMRRRLKHERTVILGGFLPVAALGLVAAYYFSQIAAGPVAAMEEYLRGSLSEAAKLYAGMGAPEMAELIRSTSYKFIYYFVRLSPSLASAIAALQSLCCYVVARMLIVRKSGPSSGLDQTPLSAWHAPDVWVWGLIAALGLAAISYQPGNIAGWNLAVLYVIVYTIQGMAVLEHALKKISIPAFGRALLHAFILAMPVFVFLTALGVVDIWADFRRIRPGEKREKSS